MGYVDEEVVRVLSDTGCSDVINQRVELQCSGNISTPIEDVQMSCENEAMCVHMMTLIAIRLYKRMRFETRGSGKRNKDTFKPLPVPQQIDVNTSHRDISTPFE